MNQYELIESDLRMIRSMFAVLKKAAAVNGVRSVEIVFVGKGGDTITVGYGEAGEPAVTRIVASP